MLITVFDVETSGLPPRHSNYKRYPDPKTEYNRYDNARMVELAYVMYVYDEITKTKELVRSMSCIVNPNGEFEIQNTQIHGITHDTASTYGFPVKNILHEFMDIVVRSDKLVAHNIEFDLNIVLAECYRVGVDPTPMLNVVKRCTMKSAMNIMGLQRFPKLVNLYNDLFKGVGEAAWNQTHRALDDTNRCADVYFELHKMQQQRTMHVRV